MGEPLPAGADPDTGDYFRSDWLKPVERGQIPDARHLHVYGASDYAVTSGGGDYTVHLLAGIDADDRLYVLDLWRQQADSVAWIAAWCDLVKAWKPLEWAEEGGQINASLGPFLERTAASGRRGPPCSAQRSWLSVRSATASSGSGLL